MNTVELRSALAGDGIGLSLGAVRVRVRSDVADLAAAFGQLYADYPPESAEGFFDVTVAVRRVRGLRRFLRPQVELVVDGDVPFEPFPADTHLPLLEWGLNHALAERFLHSLLLHSGVVERGGVAVVLPAIPGSGKSTLTAGLMCRGYRLLSDEFGVIDLRSGAIVPLVRPIALKNESIGVIRKRFPEAVMGRIYPRTRKGDVAHLLPTRESIARRHEMAVPRVIVFPRFEKAAACRVEEVDAMTAFSKASVNSFNYEFLGPKSFDAVARLVRHSVAKRIIFGNMDDAVDAIDDIVGGLPPL